MNIFMQLIALAFALLLVGGVFAAPTMPEAANDSAADADATNLEERDLGVSRPSGPWSTIEKCIQSCDDGGAYFIGVSYAVSDTNVGCRGSSGACSWYSDPSCSVPKPLAVSPTETIECPRYPSSGWCKAAWDVGHDGKPLPTCGTSGGSGGGGGGGGGSASCPNYPVSYPHMPVDQTPYNSCIAPSNGPSYPGSGWVCLQDQAGKDSWVPVKRTQYGQIGCMSTNSWDCIWTPKSCCDRLAATGNDKSPYFECGPLHYQLWKTSGYTDPGHWCYRGWQLLNGGNPPYYGC